MAQFTNVAIRPFAQDRARGLASFKQTQGLRATGQVIISRGPFKVDGVSHAEAETRRHGPASFSMHGHARSELILRHHMINRPTELCVAGRKDGLGPAKTELD